MDHRALLRRVLHRRCVRVFDGVYHRIEQMRPDGNVARSDLHHGFLGRVALRDLFALGLLRFGVVANEDPIAEPFLLGPFERCEEHRTGKTPASVTGQRNTRAKDTNLSARDWYSLSDSVVGWRVRIIGKASESLIFVGNGFSSSGGGGGGRTLGVAFFFGAGGVDAGVAPERRFLAGSRRSRGGILRFSAMVDGDRMEGGDVKGTCR